MGTKTTVYLPDELKRALESEARRRGLSEAEVVRKAVAAAVTAPRPRAGIIDGPPFAAEVEQHLAGFGER